MSNVEHSQEEVIESKGEQVGEQASGFLQEYERLIALFKTDIAAHTKLDAGLAMMREALSSRSGPYLKEFWEVRKEVLPIFKLITDNQKRFSAWEEYDQLCHEAKRLKELIEQEAAFAVEQTELAIVALEQDLEGIASTLLVQIPAVDGLADKEKEAFVELFEAFGKEQSELDCLNAHAGRINALRKELIKIETRLKAKNKMFSRLSAAGDKVFPRRKELIKSVSDRFLESVEEFAKTTLSKTEKKNPHGFGGSIFSVRTKIKAMQALAKTLTINTHTFNAARQKLSACWDALKEVDKERKKHKTEQAAASQVKLEAFREKLKPITEAREKKELNDDAFVAKLSELFFNLKKMDLGPLEQRVAKDEIDALRKPIQMAQEAADKERRSKETQRQQERQNAMAALSKEANDLLTDLAAMDVVAVGEKKAAILATLAALVPSRAEQMAFDRLLRPLKDALCEKQEQEILNSDDRENIAQLRTLLAQRKARREEMRGKIDEYRKAKSASGLDFEKAMMYDELVDKERERLEKIDQSIEEVRKQIAKVKAKG